ncbi:MAG: hypothetical protein L0219_22820 [Phycisphaerales bacterium]|nr:hypothetical protein [Phycisphaerales bacterium]
MKTEIADSPGRAEVEEFAAPATELPISVLQQLVRARGARRGRWLSGSEVPNHMLDGRLRELFWGITESTILNEANDRLDSLLQQAAVVPEQIVCLQPQEELPLAC